MKPLIAYFSRNGQNYVRGAIRDLATGNTETVAGLLARLTGADTFRIEPAVPYSADYSQCIAEAKSDQRRNARPELKNDLPPLDAYDTVYLGYPNYWGTMPMVVMTFLERGDFSGKTILPFCTHEGSGMGQSESDIARHCPGARVGRGLPIRGAEAADAEEALKAWLANENTRPGQ